MPSFKPVIEVSSYSYQKAPTLSGSDRIYMDRTLREMAEKINNVTAAVTEIQAFLKSVYP